jgi:hypothetical protein
MDTACALNRPGGLRDLRRIASTEPRKGASSAIAGPRSSTAAPNVSPDSRRRAVLASGYAGASQRRREIILGEVV